MMKHPFMHNQLENVQLTLRNPSTIRIEDKEDILHFYKEFKQNEQSERYLIVAVKYLNGNGFVITSFFTNKITGQKWKTK